MRNHPSQPLRTAKPTRVGFRTGLCLLGAAVATLSNLSAESLWLKGGTERSMFSSKIAYRVGDILTISVNETIDFNSTQGIDTGSKSSPLIDVAGEFLNDIRIRQLEGANVTLSDLLGGRYSTTPSAVNGSTNIVSAQIPVAVIDVLPNHNLVVEGMRHLSFAGESRYVVFQGIVRPLDIDVSTNTVASNRVANAQMEFVSTGAVGDVQQKGWFTRFVDKINPF
jgi:flagellar L-ring protein precursor FlgH